MLLAWVRLVIGGFLLYLGAEWFVAGASALALALRISQLVVGLTVVAYGTSAPEVIVGVRAALTGHGEVALGNVLGSNVANVGLILGLSALVSPIRVAATLRRLELPALGVGTSLIVLFLLDGVIGRLEAVTLMGLACLYSVLAIRAGRGNPPTGETPPRTSRPHTPATRTANAAPAPAHPPLPRAALKAAAGLAILLLGGHWFVDGAVALALALGLGERIVGFTIVAVGTSLPELMTSLVAARRGHADLALGNVLGSNIFNVFLCLGAAAMVGTVGAPLRSLWLDLTALGIMTGLVSIYVRRARTLSRAEGGLALGLYVLTLIAAIAHG